MKSRVRRATKVATGKRAKSVVFHGGKVKTVGGLKKADLMKNGQGKIVSVRSSMAGKSAFKDISRWTQCVNDARKDLGITGFCPVGGPSAKGQALYQKAKSLLQQQ